MKSLNLKLNEVLIWVNLWNVPLELSSQQGLSYIASVLGVPLYMDRIAAEQEHLAFAKVRVKVPWIPLRCLACFNLDIVIKLVGICLSLVTRTVLRRNGNLELNKLSRVGNRNGVERNRKQSKAGSETRFSILIEKEVDKTNSGVDKGMLNNKDLKQPSTIADLMTSIKAQVQESLEKRTLENEGNGILVQDTLDLKKVDDIVKGKQVRVFNVSVDAQTNLVVVYSSGQNSAGDVLV
ncbi:hypothetical protein PTKIN_Ptkin16aG0088300 [Pterospermum kingtungense]